MVYTRNTFIIGIVDVYSYWFPHGEGNSQQLLLLFPLRPCSLATSSSPAHGSEIYTQHRPHVPRKLRGLFAWGSLQSIPWKSVWVSSIETIPFPGKNSICPPCFLFSLLRVQDINGQEVVSRLPYADCTADRQEKPHAHLGRSIWMGHAEIWLSGPECY